MFSKQIVKLVSLNENFSDLEFQPNQSTLFLTENFDRSDEKQTLIRIENDEIFLEHQSEINFLLNGIQIKKSQRTNLKDGDFIEFDGKQRNYKIQIEPKSTLKRQNTDENLQMKKRKISTENSQSDDDESRQTWIEKQLEALQSRTTQNVEKRENPEKKIPTDADRWETPVDGLEVFTSKAVLSREKIAAFDMDGTLILTKSGKVHPTDENDWRIGFDTSFKKLKQLHSEDFKIVVFTNQRGLARAASTEPFRKKIQFIQQKLNVPLQVFVCIRAEKYRKPSIGSWLLLQSTYNDGIQIDLSKSFYVGDAAGRPDKWRPKAKKDHSCADRLFALNVGLKFYTPEEYFLGLSKAPFEMAKFDPKSLLLNRTLLEPSTTTLKSEKTEIIVMCGLPASGKSWFAKHHLVPLGYQYINRDELGTWQKCVKMAETALGQSQSVVIDNTNLDKESRQRYLELAKRIQVACRCFMMNVSLEQTKHNNSFRQMIGTDKAHKDINDIVILGANKRYIKPTKDEGFNEIVLVNCIPEFNDKNIEKLYFQYILDK